MRAGNLLGCLSPDRMPGSLLKLRQKQCMEGFPVNFMVTYNSQKSVAAQRNESGGPHLSLVLPQPSTHPHPLLRYLKTAYPPWISPWLSVPSLPPLSLRLSFNHEVAEQREKTRGGVTWLAPSNQISFWWKCLAAAKIRFSLREGVRKGGMERETGVRQCSMAPHR